MQTTIQLMRKAVTLFPRTEFSNAEAVRHARRQWLRSVVVLRRRPDGSRWVVDGACGWTVPGSAIS